MTTQTKVTGVILAGGQARRMNYRDKGLQLFYGQTLISYSFYALNPIVDSLIISANRNLEEYQKWNVPVVCDITQDFSGALAGILAAMNYAKTELLLVVPCDAPFISTEQLQHLLSQHRKYNPEITVACTGGQIHSVFLVVQTSLQSSLETYLAQGNHKMRLWFEKHKTHYVNFGAKVGGFENINTLAELKP